MDKKKTIIYILLATTAVLVIVVAILVSLLIKQNSQQTAQDNTQSSSSSETTSSSTSTRDKVDLSSDEEVPTQLPLGDKKYTSTPKVGYIFVCNSNFNGKGAFQAGPWLDEANKIWYPAQKFIVDGDVHWTGTFNINLAGNDRVISGNGLPTNHNTGIYPIQTTDDAYQYDKNPNSISTQTISLTLPANPTVATSPGCIFGQVGISLSGIPIFDGFDAEGRDAVAHEIQDKCDGHPERTGQYHYHSLSRCLESKEDEYGYAKLVGYAYDGFGIYGTTENGETIKNEDLDECHGHIGEIEWDRKTVNMYHYHTTHEFPYTVGCFKGKSYEPRPSGPQ